MIYTQKIKDAIRLAVETHEINWKQKRKGGDAIPYITHPLTVGLILARAGASEDVIVAGILHDTIEDSIKDKKVTREMLAEQFGETIAALVESVTEMSKGLPWEERKGEALKHIETFSNESVLLKSADVINNLTELQDSYKREGEKLWEHFKTPEPKKENILQNAYKVIPALRSRWPENPLASELKDTMSRLTEIETRFVEGSTKGFFIGKNHQNGTYDRWFVPHLSEEELANYKELGKGGSPLGMTFHMMLNHSPGTYERIAGYRVSEEGIGKMINEAMKKKLPDHEQARPGMGFTYILYEKK